jgi:hypothetical protein
MERIMNSQAYAKAKDPSQNFYASQKKTLEINPYHPLVKELNKRVVKDEKDEAAQDLARVMFETATLRLGFVIRDSLDFAKRIERMLRMSMGVDLHAAVELPEEEDEEEQREEKEEDEGRGGVRRSGVLVFLATPLLLTPPLPSSSSFSSLCSSSSSSSGSSTAACRSTPIDILSMRSIRFAKSRESRITKPNRNVAVSNITRAKS